jgi:hypothetical protein
MLRDEVRGKGKMTNIHSFRLSQCKSSGDMFHTSVKIFDTEYLKCTLKMVHSGEVQW